MQKHIEKITNVTCRVASLSGFGRSPLASRHYRAGLSRNSASRLETNLQYSSSLVKLEESQFTYLTAAKASLNRSP
jgi:hypothetical protein